MSYGGFCLKVCVLGIEPGASHMLGKHHQVTCLDPEDIYLVPSRLVNRNGPRREAVIIREV